MQRRFWLLWHNTIAFFVLEFRITAIDTLEVRMSTNMHKIHDVTPSPYMIQNKIIVVTFSCGLQLYFQHHKFKYGQIFNNYDVRLLKVINVHTIMIITTLNITVFSRC